MKKIFIVFLVAFLFCGSLKTQAQNDSITLYFNTEELPDLIKCLAPPPAFNSPEFSYDVERYSDSTQCVPPLLDAMPYGRMRHCWQNLTFPSA